MDETIAIRDADFWMNSYRELLAIDEAALERMQALVTASAGSPDDYEPDIRLVTSEVERVKDRLRYWEIWSTGSPPLPRTLDDGPG